MKNKGNPNDYIARTVQDMGTMAVVGPGTVRKSPRQDTQIAFEDGMKMGQGADLLRVFPAIPLQPHLGILPLIQQLLY